MAEKFDLLLTGGTVLNPATKLNQILDVGVTGNRVAAIGAGLPRAHAKKVLEVAGCYVTPGLIDFHVHSYWGVNPYGCELDDAVPGDRRDDDNGCRLRRSGQFAWLSQTCLREVQNAHDRFCRPGATWGVKRAGRVVEPRLCG